MFTGLVEGVGQITELTPQGSGFLIRIKTSFNLEGTKVGDSIAVDGVCLTVVQLEPQAFRAQLSPETISRTTFKLKKVGDLVNLERALKLGDRLGGHLVTGHVDGVGAIRRIAKMGDYTLIEISIPKDLIQYMVPKGSIAVDGISL
ncbi:MAG: riboflavin synthase, partial [Caldimicrobium sp.]|nr:riboflavin synthase [Caldimicrobium sp.]